MKNLKTILTSTLAAGALTLGAGCAMSDSDAMRIGSILIPGAFPGKPAAQLTGAALRSGADSRQQGLDAERAREEYETRVRQQSMPSAVIDRVWEDYDVTLNGTRGVDIHANFRTYNAQGKNLNGYIYLYDARGNKLMSENGRFKTAEGQIAFKMFSIYLKDENAAHTYYSLLIPYSQLGTIDRPTTFQYLLRIVDGNDESSILAQSPVKSFPVIIP